MKVTIDLEFPVECIEDACRFLQLSQDGESDKCLLFDEVLVKDTTDRCAKCLEAEKVAKSLEVSDSSRSSAPTNNINKINKEVLF